jgi:hypothetical protein
MLGRRRSGSKKTVFLVLAFHALGCAGSGGIKTVPVAGRITVHGQPLNADNAMVVFKPADGNLTRYEPYGSVNEKGQYTLSIGPDRKGAEPGRYIVLVTAYESPQTDVRTRLGSSASRLLVSRRYGDPKTSGLLVDVVENPAAEAYDFQLTDEAKTRR